MRRTLTFLMALMLSIGLAQAQKVIYDQVGTTDLGNKWTSSEGNGFQTYQALSADDIDVPAGGMTLTGIEFTYSNNWFDGMKIYIYEDNAGVPGDIYENFTYTASECVITPDGSYFLVKAMFPYDVALLQGKYWFSVSGNGYYFNGQWIFNDDETTAGSSAKYKALTDDLMANPLPNPTWGDYTYPWGYVYDGTHHNLSFRLFTVPDDNDMAAKSIVAPISGATTADQAITVELKNEGLLTQSSYSVMYQVSSTIDGTLTQIGTATETVTHSLARDEVYDYTFTQKVDMSTLTTYSIMARVTLSGDLNNSNDVTTSSVTNYGEVHQLGVNRVDTTCGGILVDNGGVEGNYTIGNDTITIYPSTTGSRSALDFTLFDIYYYDLDSLTIWDGASTNGAVLYNGVYGMGQANLHSPGFIRSRSADGALTIMHKTSESYVDGTHAGFMAYVSCVTPNAVEFTTLGIQVGEPYEYFQKGKAVDVKALVTNAGADTIARTIYLIENGSIVATRMTDTIIPGVVDTVHFNWTPSVISDDVTLQVLIEKDPQETNTDNMVETHVTTYAPGILLESFESENLPLEWISKTGESKVIQNYYNATNGHNAFMLYGKDTVIMPLMKPSVVDKMKFDAYIYNPYKIMLLASSSINGPWTVVDSAVYISYSLNPYTLNISDYEGKPTYFALTVKGATVTSSFYIDNVRGATLYHYNTDLFAKSLEGSAFIKTNAEAILKAKVYNVGVNDVMGKDYTVNIRTADSIYATVNGMDVMTGKYAEFEVPVTFATEDTLALYTEVVMASDERMENNVSAKYTAIVTDNYIFGMPVTTTTSYLIRKGKKSSISEAIYYPSEIQGYGNLNGIQYTYNNASYNVDTLPIRVFVATLEDSLLINADTYTPSWIETDSIAFTKVFEGRVPYKKENNALMYIPFDAPFAYDGTKNIIVMVVRDSTAATSSYESYSASQTTTGRFIYGYDNVQINPANIQFTQSYYAGLSTYSIPAITWYFSNSGAPAFETNAPAVVNENAEYSYETEVAYSGPNSLVIAANMLPEWLTLTQNTDTTATLSGVATTPGMYAVQLIATDSVYSATQTFNIKVNAVPVFVTEANTAALINEEYSYTAEVSYNGEGVVAISGGSENPTWLTVTDNGDNTATVSGTPDAAGDYTVTIIAAGDVTTEQVYTLTIGAMPEFTAIEDAMVNEGSAYSLTVNVSYDGLGTVAISSDNLPTWLTLTDNGDKTATLSGTAETGEYTINLMASDGTYESTASYMLTVAAVPSFTSEPVLIVNNHEVYTYNVTVAYSGDDVLSLNADAPAWLTFTDNGDNTATLTGTPEISGVYAVSITAYGKYNHASQTFTISVDPNAINSANAGTFNIYPNPASNWITIEGSANGTLTIYDLAGKALLSKEITSDSEKVNVSELQNGMYIIKVSNDQGAVSQRLVIE